MRPTVIVQAHLGSRRLPRKILMGVAGRPLLAHVVTRARQIRGVSPWVVIAVPEPDVYEIANALWHSSARLGSGPFRNVVIFGSSRPDGDVLGRYVDAATFIDASAVVRITSDCPMLSPGASSLVVARFLQGDVGYCSNVGVENGWPDGWDTEVVSWDVLRHMDSTITDPYHREHVTTWLRMTAHDFRVANVKSPVDRSREKWSVDCEEDLAKVRELLERRAA
ncbi:MAG: hypothetical protein NUW01_03555 [Gemmatimonadaceae bacterium]|nr:hypothetical protein [Gemmatimonadaceae bacterium]